MALLEERDPVRRLVLQAVLTKAVEINTVHRRNLAVEIANNLGKVLGG